jgi:WS/DGAT/MGAT family acyltransferase
MFQIASSPVNHAAKKLVPMNCQRDDGRNAFTVNQAPTTLTARKIQGTHPFCQGRGGGTIRCVERLTGLDAAFLSLETPSNHMHLILVAVLDPSEVPGGFNAATMKQLIEQRIDTLPPFRRRVVRVPFGLHHPLWIEDPGFDLDFHVRQVAVPAPGGERELAAFVGEVAGWPLDRDRPLWQMWVVEGLEHGHVALVAKVHHAAIDGASGVEVLASLVDLEPTPVPAVVNDEPWHADRVPSDVEMIGASMVSIARQPMRMARATVHLGRSLARLVTRMRNEDVHAGVPFTAPRLSWNVMITPHRQVAFAGMSLDDVKLVKDAYGATVNDVVLAVLSGAFRRYFVARAELPDRPLVAVIPTSVRSMDEKQLGNRVSAMFTQLSTDLDDPLDRLAAVQDTMSGAKQVHEDIGGNTLEEWAELAAPAMLSRGARLYSQLRLADRHPPIHNLVVSNVPGPQFPLYMAGARLVDMYPMGPVFDGAGLNVTAMSYRDRVDIGFMACLEAVPDLWALAAEVPEALAELVKVARDATPAS